MSVHRFYGFGMRIELVMFHHCWCCPGWDVRSRGSWGKDTGKVEFWRPRPITKRKLKQTVYFHVSLVFVIFHFFSHRYHGGISHSFTRWRFQQAYLSHSLGWDSSFLNCSWSKNPSLYLVQDRDRLLRSRGLLSRLFGRGSCLWWSGEDHDTMTAGWTRNCVLFLNEVWKVND